MTRDARVERLARLSGADARALAQRLAVNRVSGFDLVARTLAALGVTHIYGVAGVPSEGVLGASDRAGLRAIGAYHQFAAVCMALAHNYQLGALRAVALVSPGPALTNAITGLLVAHDNAWPVLLLGAKRDNFQRLDSLPLVAPITKSAVRVDAAKDIARAIADACKLSMTGRPGPVYVELHEDALRGGAAWVAPAPSIPAPVQPLDADVRTVAEMLARAERPALVIGKGCRWRVAPAALARLVETTHLPFITSPMGRGLVPEDHPLCRNLARAAVQAEADAVLVLGARFNWMFRGGAEFSPTARILRVDVEHHREDDGARTVQFVRSDAGAFVDALNAMLGEVPPATVPAARARWAMELAAVAASNRATNERVAGTRPMSLGQAMLALRDALPRDAIVITDGNLSMKAAQPLLGGFDVATRMDMGTNACIGTGVPFAIGAKSARPERAVVLITGDHAFSLAAMELEACTRQHIALVVVVINNEGNNGAFKEREYFPGERSERVIRFGAGIDYSSVGHLFCGRGESIRRPEDIGPALHTALAADTLTCLNVVADPFSPADNAWGAQAPAPDKR